MEATISILLLLLLVYLILGAMVALLLYSRGLQQIDEATADTGWGFKLLILPGLLCFWPLFLMRLFKQSAKTK